MQTQLEYNSIREPKSRRQKLASDSDEAHVRERLLQLVELSECGLLARSRGGKLLYAAQQAVGHPGKPGRAKKRASHGCTPVNWPSQSYVGSGQASQG